MEFVVDGARLGRIIGPFLGYEDVAQEYVPVLVTDWPTGIAVEDVARLVDGASEDLGGRVAIYVCAECGDLGCGGITAVVEVERDVVVWRDFGYQNTYEPFDGAAVLHSVGPFTFDRCAYVSVLEGFVQSSMIMKDRGPHEGHDPS